MDQRLIELIKETIKTGTVLEKELLKNHTTFRIGGEADYFLIPGSIKEAEELLRLLCMYKEPFVVLGNGSNVLVSDKGIRGIVVCFSKGMDEILCDGNIITAGAGAMLSKVAKCALDNCLTGMEFASGIPGSLGGAVYMNAGAYGGEMKDVITKVILFDAESREIVTLAGEDMCFAYRHSIAKEKPLFILEVQMELIKGDANQIKFLMDDLNGRRRDKQPLEYPSAGSTFKRPEGYFAGKLIEDAGLKGYSVGGAQVSEKHCGFVINRGSATAGEVLMLIKNVQEKVYEKFNVVLEPEVIMLGEEINGN